MGMLDGLLGGYGGLLQQQQQASQNYANQWYKTFYTTGTTAAATNITINGYGCSEPPKPKGPESALEWLDRRVDEMRVTL